MGILAGNGEPTPAPRGSRCRVQVVLEQLDDTDRELLLAWVSNRDIESTAIAAHVRPLGIRLTDQSIARHRARRCVCDVRCPQWAMPDG